MENEPTNVTELFQNTDVALSHVAAAAHTKPLEDVDTDGEEVQEHVDSNDEDVDAFQDEDRMALLRKEFDECFKGIQTEDDLTILHFWDTKRKEYWANQECISNLGHRLRTWELPLENNKDVKVAVSVFLGGLVHVFAKHCVPIHDLSWLMEKENFYTKLNSVGRSTFDPTVATDIMVLLKLMDHVAQFIVCKLSNNSKFLQRWDATEKFGTIPNYFFETRRSKKAQDALTLKEDELFMVYITETVEDERGYCFEAKFMPAGFQSIFSKTPPAVGFSTVGAITGNHVVCKRFKIVCRYMKYDESSKVYEFFIVSCYPCFAPYDVKSFSLDGTETTELFGQVLHDVALVKHILRENARLDYPWYMGFHVKLAIALLNTGEHKNFYVPYECCPENIPNTGSKKYKFDGSIKFTTRGVIVERGTFESHGFCLRDIGSVRAPVTSASILLSFPFFNRFLSTDFEDARRHRFGDYTFCDNLSYFCLHTGSALCIKASCLVCAKDACAICEAIV